MGLLKIFAGFFITAVLIFGFVFGMNWKSFNTFLDNRDAMAEGSEWVEKTYSLRGLSEYIEENPDHISIASVVIGSPDSTILYEAQTPRVMGTSTNFLLLLAYALEIENGTFSEDEMIDWDDVTRYQLPDVEGSNHRNAFNTAESRDWIQDNSTSLNNALHLLAEYNDLALSDYLWWKLGSDYWIEFSDRLDFTNTEMPLPFSGLYLAISPGIQQQSAEAILNRWYDAPHGEWREFVEGMSKSFYEETPQREEYSTYLRDNRLGNTFIEERDLMILFPKTTALEISTLLQKIWNSDEFSASAAERLKNWMRWPLQQQREIRQDFTDYGAIFDNRLGILNGIDFGTSTYTNDTTIQAVFFDQLPIGFWFHMSSNHMHQDFQQRLIFDPAMIDRIKEVVNRHNEKELVELVN